MDTLSSSNRLSKTITCSNRNNLHGQTEKEKTINRVAWSYYSITHIDVASFSPKSISELV